MRTTRNSVLLSISIILLLAPGGCKKSDEGPGSPQVDPQKALDLIAKYSPFRAVAEKARGAREGEAHGRS